VSTSTSDAAIRPTLPTWVLAVAVVGWFAGTAYAFWSFGLKNQRPFATAAQVATFDSGRRTADAESWFRSRFGALPSGAATVVAVYADGCSCNANTRDHAKRIADRYAARRIAVLEASARDAPVDAAPAALVFDARGHLVYYGPYSDEAFCGAGRDGFVERTLDALLAGSTPRVAPVTATGCYCDTPRAPFNPPAVTSSDASRQTT
jgi:hypothetical protein